MKSFHEYWSFSAIRGVMALFAATAIVAIPRAAASLFGIPLLLLLAVALYALYNAFDGAAMILLARVLPPSAAKSRAFLVQSSLAFLFAALLFLVGYRVLSLSWFIAIAAAQAATAALAEFLVARSTHRVYGCLSCYSTALVLAAAALALPFMPALDSIGQALALAAFLAAFGLSELCVGGRMLFLGYRAEHPAPQWLSTAWRDSLHLAPKPTASPSASPASSPAPAAAFAAAPNPQPAAFPQASCSACPAGLLCRDTSLEAQLASLLSSRQPSIVNTVRAASLVHAHH